MKRCKKSIRLMYLRFRVDERLPDWEIIHPSLCEATKAYGSHFYVDPKKTDEEIIDLATKCIKKLLSEHRKAGL